MGARLAGPERPGIFRLLQRARLGIARLGWLSAHCAGRASGASEEALQPEPLLGEKRLAVIPTFQLVANSRGGTAVGEVRRAEQNVPERKQGREIAPESGAFVSHAHRVVRAVEARTDQQPLAERAEPEARIRV